MWDDSRKARLREDLLGWFAGRKRQLPWRDAASLYGTWISEIMLQQTTVSAVIPYYERFLKRFPDVKALACADESTVLELWSGLGYYRRASMLHQSARIIVGDHGGILPQTREQWRSLPGVGDYASGAIASIGLGECVPALDANAKRVLTRWLCADSRCAEKMKGKQLERLAAEIVDPRMPGDWNEAVMELGALVCRSQGPKCSDCPVFIWCRAGSAGTAGTIPSATKRLEPTAVTLAQLVVAVDDKLLLVAPGSPPLARCLEGPSVVRNDFSTLHRGLWGFPTSAWYLAGSSFSMNPCELWQPVMSAMKMDHLAAEPRLVGECRHTITRYRLHIQVYLLRVTKGRVFGNSREGPKDIEPGAVGGDSSPFSLFTRSLVGVPVSRLAMRVLATALPPKS